MLLSLIKQYPDLYLAFINNLFTSVTPLATFDKGDWRDAEAVLSFVFYFGEGCNVNYQNSVYKGIVIY